MQQVNVLEPDLAKHPVNYTTLIDLWLLEPRVILLIESEDDYLVLQSKQRLA